MKGQLVLLTFILGLTLSTGPLGQTDTNTVISFQAPSTITLGEPIAINVVLRNNLGESIVVGLGMNRIGNLRLRLRKPGG
jgi:hypothetical protein